MVMNSSGVMRSQGRVSSRINMYRQEGSSESSVRIAFDMGLLLFHRFEVEAQLPIIHYCASSV